MDELLDVLSWLFLMVLACVAVGVPLWLWGRKADKKFKKQLMGKQLSGAAYTTHLKRTFPVFFMVLAVAYAWLFSLPGLASGPLPLELTLLYCGIFAPGTLGCIGSVIYYYGWQITVTSEEIRI